MVAATKRSSDAELARSIQTGGAQAGSAEAEISRRFWQRARLYGLRHLRDVTEAEDLAQQVMEVTLTALRSGRVNDVDRLDRYVLGVCRNVTHELRRSGRRTKETAERLAREPASEMGPPPEPPWGTESVENLTFCLYGLSQREQRIVQMSFYEWATSTEIAERLGVETGNVRVIRHRALRKLRECMDRSGDRA